MTQLAFDFGLTSVTTPNLPNEGALKGGLHQLSPPLLYTHVL